MTRDELLATLNAYRTIHAQTEQLIAYYERQLQTLDESCYNLKRERKEGSMAERIVVNPPELDKEIQELASKGMGQFYDYIEYFHKEALIDTSTMISIKKGAKDNFYGLSDGIKNLINKYGGK